MWPTIKFGRPKLGDSIGSTLLTADWGFQTLHGEIRRDKPWSGLHFRGGINPKVVWIMWSESLIRMTWFRCQGTALSLYLSLDLQYKYTQWKLLLRGDALAMRLGRKCVVYGILPGQMRGTCHISETAFPEWGNLKQRWKGGARFPGQLVLSCPSRILGIKYWKPPWHPVTNTT